MNRGSIVAALTVALSLLLGNVARAAVYLVGLQLYPATSTGAASANNYHFTTNTTSGTAAKFNSVSGGGGGTVTGTNIAVVLNDGLNTIAYDNSTTFNPADYGGTHTAINLFFATTATPYNPNHPALGGPASVPSDLTISAAVNGAPSNATPAAGTSIYSYNSYGGGFNILTTYGGATSFTVGAGASARVITPIAYTSTFVNGAGPDGTFTLLVSPVQVPEPASALLVFLPLTLIGMTRRRS